MEPWATFGRRFPAISLTAKRKQRGKWKPGKQTNTNSFMDLLGQIFSTKQSIVTGSRQFRHQGR